VLALVVFAWMFRYDMRVSNGLNVYVTDRWTGNMYSCSSFDCRYRFRFQTSN